MNSVMFGRRKYKLTTLIVLLVTSSVLLTAVVQLFTSYQAEKNNLIESVMASNYSKVNKLGGNVDSIFDSMRLSLKSTTEYLTLSGDMSEEQLQDRLDLARNSGRYFNSMLWFDTEGIVRAASPVSLGLVGKEGSEASKVAVDAAETYISAPYIGTTGRLLILMGEPFYDKDGEYKGIIGGTIYLREDNVLSELLEGNERDPNGAYYYVVGSDGTLLFHPDSNRVGEDVGNNPLVRQLEAGRSGTQRLKNTQGIEMLSAYRYVEDTGWGIVQQTPAASIREQLVRQVQGNLLYLIAPFLLILFISIYLTHKLVQPINYLAGLVDQSASGQTVSAPRVQSHWIEADLLMKSVTLAIERQQELNEKLVREAGTDALTGLANRRAMTSTIDAWAAEGRLFSVVVLDIDHFKQVNDTYGHQVGDEVLQALAGQLKDSLRATDLSFRYGGEEFVILLPDTNASDAYLLAERLRKFVARAMSPTGQPVTVSLGVAEYPAHGDSPSGVFSLADQALYTSKTNGRNRTTVASSTLK